jgi:DNA-directed RNA polymerase subunit RPC12/RpoP
MAKKAVKARASKRTAAVEEFEATCPSCGMTADVGAATQQVRCKSCGSVILLVDHPVSTWPFQSPPAPAPMGSEMAWPWPASFLALGGGFLLVAPLMAYNFAIDHSEPQAGLAAMWLVVTLLGFAALAFQVRRLLRDDRSWMGILLSGIVIGLLGIAPAYVIAADYGKEGGAFLAGIGPFVAFLYLYLPSLVIAGVAAGISAIWSRRTSGAILAAYGLGVAVGIALVAAYMLMTISAQAEEAREANEAPAWGFLLAISVLLGMAASRHRRLTP